MATYTTTVTVDHPRAERISRNLGMIVGTCNITTYSTTGAAITDITKYFKTIKRVVTDGVTDEGYPARWDASVGCFNVYTTTDTSGVLAELASGNAGAINFIAIGLLH